MTEILAFFLIALPFVLAFCWGLAWILGTIAQLMQKAK
jgi:hypothetical protein